MSERRGHIWWEAYVDCGMCGDMEPVGRYGARAARDQGWRLTRKHGWICPECGIEADTAADGMTGPESSRDEVTGQGSGHTSWGFIGGRPERVAPASNHPARPVQKDTPPHD